MREIIAISHGSEMCQKVGPVVHIHDTSSEYVRLYHIGSYCTVF